MSPGIYNIDDSGRLVELTEQPYISEDDLQALLEQHPELLADAPAGQPRRLLLLAREAGLPSEQDGPDRWSVDHLFLDKSALPILVEVKRSTDSRLRREVVGQMLDYAANAVVYWPIESLRTAFEETCAKRGGTPEDALSDLLGPDADQEAFWQTAKTNLLAGRIRMIFVADLIPPELQRIVEFLNGQMSAAEVLAIEIKQYVGERQRTLVPRLLGQTAAAEQAKGIIRARKQWDEASFFSDLESRSRPEEAAVARAIVDWARAGGQRIVFGEGATRGSLYPRFDHNGLEYGPIGILSTGKIELWFGWMESRPPFDSEAKRLELLDKINQVPGLDLPPEAANRFPSIPLASLQEPDALKTFLAALDWFITQARST